MKIVWQLMAILIYSTACAAPEPHLILYAKGITYKCEEPDPKPFNICFKVGEHAMGAEKPEYDPPPGTEIEIIYHADDIHITNPDKANCLTDCINRDIMEIYKTEVIIPEKFKKQ